MNSIAVSNIAQEHFSHFRNLLLENDDLFQIWQIGMGDGQLTEMEEAKFYELCSEHIFRMAATYRTFSEIAVASDLTGAAFVVRGNISQSDRYASCWNRLRPAFRARANFDFVDRVEDRTE